MVPRSDGLQWKSAWRRTWALPTKWHCWFWEPVRNCARNALTRSLVAKIIGFGQKSAWKRTWTLPTKLCCGSEGLQWKLVWRRTWALQTKWHCQIWYHTRAKHVIAHDADLNTVIRSFWEGLRWKSHKGGHGRCQWNDIICNKMTVASYGAHEFISFRQKVVARIIRFGQKSAWRRTWLLPTKWYRQVLGHAHAARYIRCTSTVYGGQKLRVAMKFDMKGEMGIADKMMLQLIVNKAN